MNKSKVVINFNVLLILIDLQCSLIVCLFSPYTPTDFEIVFGRSQTNFPEHEQRITPREILIHPSNDRALFEYDVALIQV